MGIKLVNNNIMLENTNECKIIVIHANPNIVHEIFNIENPKMIK